MYIAPSLCRAPRCDAALRQPLGFPILVRVGRSDNVHPTLQQYTLEGFGGVDGQVQMGKLNEAAMKEAATNSRCILAIVTGVCPRAEPDEGEKPEDNAYFKRPYCMNELRWAREASVPIQPVIRAEDKKNIGGLLSLAPEDLRDLGKVDFIVNSF